MSFCIVFPIFSVDRHDVMLQMCQRLVLKKKNRKKKKNCRLNRADDKSTFD